MARIHTLLFAALALLPISGCFGGDGSEFIPGTKFKETKNTVHLKATVVDYDSELYPGLQSWLWAFCFAPVDPNDEYSAKAIEGWTPLPGDKVANQDSNTLGDFKCGVPGPTLRVKQGDRVKVEFAHSHFHPHTIHWHGQFVEPASDGAPGVTQDSVPAGGSYTYDFIAKRAGTLWYHCHVDTQFHVQQGLYGMMIVEPQDTSLEPKGVDREYNIILSTMNRNVVEQVGSSRHSHPAGCASGFSDFNGAPCENPTTLAGQPDVFLINGHSYPFTMEQVESLIVMKPGERIRLRILNAGETFEELHPHGHDMLVTHKDGNPIPEKARVYQDTLKIGPAERYDVIIDANNPGPWMIHTHVNSHETNCGKAPGGMHTMMVYEDYLDKMHEFRAEQAVDCPKGETLVLPGDFNNRTTLLGSQVQPQLPVPVPGASPAPWTGSWTWPVTLPCAVREMGFYARTIQDRAAATANPADVDLVLKAPDGTSTSLTLGALDSVSYVLKENSLGNLTTVAGDYLLEVSGYGQDVELELDVTVDYYESFEQSKIGHLTYKVGGCTGFT